MKLNNNTILITGGGSGIGFALALALSKYDNEIIVVGRSRDKLEAACNVISNASFYCCDLSQEAHRTDLIESLYSKHPRLNVIINNAGAMVVENLATRPKTTVDDRNQFSINYEAPVHLTLGLMDLLRSQSNATIINVTTALVYVPFPAAPSYCASKSALHAFTAALRVQLVSSAIEIYEIFPPIVKTTMSRELGLKGMDVDDFAQSVVMKLREGVFEIRVGQSKFLYLLSRYFPSFIQKKMNQHAKQILQNI